LKLLELKIYYEFYSIHISTSNKLLLL